MKTEELKSLMKDLLGEVQAERRAESEAKGRELAEKPQEVEHKYVNPLGDKQEKLSEAPSEPGIKAARFIRYMANAKGNPNVAAQIARSQGDTFMEKALNESIFSAGGALVPGEWMSEVTEFLRARAVVRSMGPQMMPMPRGQLFVPYQDSGSTANYQGELGNADHSQPSFGGINLSAKKLSCLVSVSNDLLRDSPFAADRIIRDDMVKAMANREDLAFIRDDGTGFKPKGLRYLADPANVQAQTALSGDPSVEVLLDLSGMVLDLENANINIDRGGFLMAPSVAASLARLRSSTGDTYLFKDELRGGTLLGYPVAKTTQIPTNLGGGTKSEVYFADFSTIVIGETEGLEVAAFDGGAYVDGAGNVQSGISQDSSVIRATGRHDIGARQRGKEVSVRTGIVWQNSF
jgi:HK97 family phage major capsid protein